MANDVAGVIGASDGPVLVLGDGTVARPRLFDPDGEPLVPWSIHPSGDAIYGREVDDDYARLSFEPDPGARVVDAVESVLHKFGLGDCPECGGKMETVFSAGSEDPVRSICQSCGEVVRYD